MDVTNPRMRVVNSEVNETHRSHRGRVGCPRGRPACCRLSRPPLSDRRQHVSPLLESRLTRALGREVKLGDLKLSLLSGSVTANDLAIADDPAYSHTAFVQAKSLAVKVELWPLLASRQLQVTGLEIDQPAI